MIYVLIFKFFIYIKLYYPIYFFLRLKIIKPVTVNKSAQVKCLMLSIEKFRGDFNELNKRSDTNVYCLSQLWLSRLYLTFYPKRKKQDNKTQNLLVPNTNKIITNKQKNYHFFLIYFLRKIFNEFQINCILSADVRYISDIDFGLVSEKLGTPYIVLHRENLFASKQLRKLVKERLSKWGNFQGSKLIVHNKVSKKVFLESGFVSNSNKELIEIGGCLRMDSFFNNLYNKNKTSQKCITFFPFQASSSNPWPKSFIKSINKEILKFAIKNPDVDIFIKPKGRTLRKTNWWDDFKECSQEIEIDYGRLKNLKISSNFDTYELLQKSLYIIALNSTVILEAGLLGKPIIIPFFDKYKKFKDYVYFNKHFSYYDIPKNPRELQLIFKKRLKENFVSNIVQKKRKGLFKKYFHFFDQNISDIYFKIIYTTIKEKNDRKF